MFWVAFALAGEWRVVETEHFRVQYPVEAEAFATRVASQLEGLRQRANLEVGAENTPRTQIVIRDPHAQAGAFLAPRGRSPRLEIWATPRDADRVDGAVGDGLTSLLAHLDGSVVFETLPPRAIPDQILLWLLGIAPIPAKAPNWVAPAYATLLESRMTPHGRGSNDGRAVWLRQLAVSGELPDYEELEGADRWGGDAFAPDVGSAYLEWLERHQPGGLQKVWARMTATYPRSFNESFQGVYQDRSSALYKVFCAELTAAAVAHHAPADTLWMYLLGDVSTPAVSPDGRLLALVHEPLDGPAVLRVFETAVDTARVERRDAKIAQILERDPHDAKAMPPRAPPHKTRTSWTDRTRVPSHPRWLDRNTLLYVAPVNGGLRRDLFRLKLGGTPSRVAKDVHRADARAGRIVGLRHRWGQSSLVELGERETVLVPEEAGVVFDQPRLSPDGTGLAWLRNAGSAWEVWVRNAEGDRQLDLPDSWQVRSLAWGEHGLIGAVGTGGRVDIVDLETVTRLTSSGSAFAPEPVGEDVFHLELTAHGYTLHKRARSSQPELPAVEGLLGRQGPGEPVPLTPVESRRLGLGRLEPRVLLGGRAGAGSIVEAGLRLADLAGRNEFALMGSLGTVSGGGAWWTGRQLPVETRVRIWALQQQTAQIGGSVDLRFARQGSFVSGGVAGGLWGETDRGGVHAGVELGWLEPRGRNLEANVWARAQGGWEGQLAGLAQAGARVRLGTHDVFFLDLEGEAGRAVGQTFSLGGLRSELRAPPAQWSAIQPGWIGSGSASGQGHDRIGAVVGRQTVGLKVERHRVHDGSAVGSWSLGGLQVRRELAAEPLLGMPAVVVEAGVGCLFEKDGVVGEACREITDYRFWSGVIWRP